jgi:hypothetical protein
MKLVRFATLLVGASALGCSGSSPVPPVPEAAVPQAVDPAVPAPVQEGASRIVRRLGRTASCAGFRREAEQPVWRCSLGGLARSAELDLDPEGRFVELELELGLPEIEETAPAAAIAVAAGCRQGRRGTPRLSIRAEPLVTPDPRLAALWGRDHVFIEVACPDGSRFELDAFGTVVPE